jgi:hypothetical protein
MMDRLSRWAPLAGVVYAVLFTVVLFATPSTPDVDASPTKIIDFYASHRGGMQVQVYLLAYCAVFAVVFFAVMSARLRSLGANVLARVAFAGSLILAAGYAVGAGTSAMLTHKSVTLDAGSAQALNLVNNDLPFIALFVGLVLAMIATGVAVLSTKALPTWMGWVAIVAGVGTGIGTWLSWIGLMLSGLWILVASVMLYVNQDSATAAMPAGGSDRIPAQGEAQASESGMAIGG